MCGMVELPHQRDLPEKPVRRDADQKLGVQNLQGDRFSRGIGRVEDARRAPAADLPIDLVGALEGLAHQRQNFARNWAPCPFTRLPD